MVTCEVNLFEEEIINELCSIFPGCPIGKKRFLSSGDIAELLVPAATIVTALSSSKVLVKYIESRKIKIKVKGIEYEGRAKDLPNFLKKEISSKDD